MDIEQVIKIATETAITVWEKQHLEHRRQLQNTRLWNTRMLLKHYKSLRRYCEKAVYKPGAEILPEGARDILETLGNCSKDTYIESVKSSVLRTRTIMSHVDAMIKLFEVYCETSDKPEDKRRFRILQATYFYQEKLSVEGICELEQIDKSTYYRDNRESTEMLSALIFGADGLSALKK